MAYGLILVVHIFVSVVLIAVILLQAGKGGLAETMGGSTAQAILGTSAGTFLTRATSACAVLFVITCISLTVLSSRQSASLLRGRSPTGLPTPAPAAPAPAAQTPSPASAAPEAPVPEQSTPNETPVPSTSP